jgi:hypothetical protein
VLLGLLSWRILAVLGLAERLITLAAEVAPQPRKTRLAQSVLAAMAELAAEVALEQLINLA